MPVDYSIDHVLQLVMVKAWGTFTAKDLTDYQREVWSRPDVNDYDELLDLSRIEAIVQQPADHVREEANSSAEIDAPKARSRFVIVAPMDASFAWARVFAAFRNLHPQSTRTTTVFQSLQEARSFMGVSIDADCEGTLPIRVLLVEGFNNFLRPFLRIPELQIVGEATDGLQAVRKAEELQPDIVLLDVKPAIFSGVDVLRRLVSVAPHVRVLFVSEESSLTAVREALQAGAGYVYKLHAATDLQPAIRAALENKQFVSPALEINKNKKQTREAKQKAKHRSSAG